MIVFWILVVWGFGIALGISIRGWIADAEHDYRWWVEGCRHNIHERWRQPRRSPVEEPER